MPFSPLTDVPNSEHTYLPKNPDAPKIATLQAASEDRPPGPPSPGRVSTSDGLKYGAFAVESKRRLLQMRGAARNEAINFMLVQINETCGVIEATEGRSGSQQPRTLSLCLTFVVSSVECNAIEPGV